MSTEPRADDEEAPFTHFAEGKVTCPVCGVHIAVPVLARIDRDWEGVQRMETQPDMTELWAHTWGHEAKEQP